MTNSDNNNYAISPRLLYTIAKRLSLRPDKIQQLLRLTGLIPDSQTLQNRIDQFMLLAGMVFIAAGVAAFFAFNWAELHKYYKFGILQGIIILSVGVTWFKGIDSLIGKGSLAAAAFFVGVLFAVYGQVYQTGADPYGLFLTWLILILPWAIIGRQAGLWLLAIILANLSLVLFWHQVLYPQTNFLSTLFGPVFGLAFAMSDPLLSQVLLALNVAIIVAWEVFTARGVGWMQVRWLPRLLICLAFYIATVATIVQIFDGFYRYNDSAIKLMPLWFLILSVVSIWFYQTRIKDLFVLAVTAFCIVMVVTAEIAHISSSGVDTALLMAILLLLQIAAATYWLRHVVKSWKLSPDE